MKNKLLLTLILIIFNSSYSQENNLNKIIWEFSCFKSPDQEYKLDLKTKELTIKNLIRYRRIDKDTILFHKTYKFTDKEFEKFQKEINQDIPDSIINKSERGTDGFGFVLNYHKTSGGISKLKARLPNRKSNKYTIEFKKIDAFFDFAYLVVRDSSGIDVLDQTYRPYFTGVPIRKISENPSEYKVWGTISGNSSMNSSFFTFLNSLPKDECIIIDCNDKLSYAWQEDILKLFMIQDSNIHFINTDYLKYTREYLLKIREEIKKAGNNQEKLNKLKRNSTYHLYNSDTKRIDDWLELSEKERNITIEEIRKNCR